MRIKFPGTQEEKEAVCSDPYYKRLELILSKNFDEENTSVEPQKGFNINSDR